jgi:L-methionine (R)-S-oxide reductase
VEATDKPARYRVLAAQLSSLLEGEPDLLANAANMASLIYNELPLINWAGFYVLKNAQLVLGPFQGRPACTRIPFGGGVCGTAAARQEAVVVANVHEFPGHIACDSASQSEIVIPIIANGRLLGVFDVDSPVLDRFDAEDEVGLKSLVEILVRAMPIDSAANQMFSG